MPSLGRGVCVCVWLMHSPSCKSLLLWGRTSPRIYPEQTATHQNSIIITHTHTHTPHSCIITHTHTHTHTSELHQHHTHTHTHTHRLQANNEETDELTEVLLSFSLQKKMKYSCAKDQSFASVGKHGVLREFSFFYKVC